EEICFFFFQAEDGIRDRNVTGVQTCALPIFDITEKMPVMDVKIEDKTLFIQEEKVDQIKASYYSIGNDLITNQFKKNPEDEEEWAEFYDGEYIVILHLPHHISVKDDGIVTFIDGKSSMN